MKDWTKYTKTELLKLPDRSWDAELDKVYDELLIVPGRTKHDSGYSHIAIIGVIGSKPIEILAYPDDIELPKALEASSYSMDFRMDCSYPHGVLRLWSNRYKFKVGFPTSSTTIVAVKRETL